MTNFVWFGGKGNWSDAGDWTPHMVPNGGAAAVAINSGNVTVSHTYSIGAHFDLGAATITGTGALNIDGSDNSFSGSAKTAALITGALSVNTNGTSAFAHLTIGGNAKITNQGDINEENRVTIGDATGNKAAFINAAPVTGQQDQSTPGGTYILEASSGIVAGGSGAQFDNYGTFIKAGGIGTSGIGVNFKDTGPIIVSEGTLSFYNTASFSGRISGLGTLLLEGGTSQDPNIKQTFANANIDVASVTIAGLTAATKTNPAYAADSVEVTANTICSSIVAIDPGATLTIAPRAALTLTGGNFITPTSLSGTISGGGTLVLKNGIQSLVAGVALDGPALSMSDNDVLTIDTSDTSLTDSHTFTQGSGTTLRIVNGDTLVLTGKATLAGTVTGGGTLNLAGGSQSLNQGATLKNLVMSGSDKLTVNAPVSDMGKLTQHAGTVLTVGGDGSLDFQGSNVTLGGTTTLNDAAAITVENGTLLNTGTLISTGTSTASLVADDGLRPRHGRGTISSFGNSGLVDIRSDESSIIRPDQPGVVQSNELDVTGSLSNINNGKVHIGSSTAGGTSTLGLDGGGTSTAGAFTVYATGVLDFAGSTFNLTGGTAAGEATLAGGGQVNLAGGALELGGSAITIACQFSQDAGSILDGTGTLTLTDGVNFTDDSGTAVEMGGKKAKTLLKSATTVSGDLALDGGRTLENAKGETLTWAAGDFYLGIDPLGVTVGGGTIMNDAGGTFDIESDGVVARGAGVDTFSNAGTVTVTDSSKHTTTIATTFANLATGVVDVKSGTLDIAGVVRGSGTAGTGTIEIDGGTLKIDTTLTQNQVTFTPAGGNLVLADPSAFLGSIKNLGTNDAIDLTGPGFGAPGASSTTKLNYVGNSTTGVLTITDGKLRAQLILFGDYVTAGFQESAYSGGGTEITYVQPSPGHLELAPEH